jgi:MFS family permease
MIVYNVLPIVLPIYLSYPPFSASPAEIGLLTAMPALASLLLRIPFGILSDKKGKKPILAMSLFSAAASSMMFYYSKDVSMLIFSGIVYGISSSTFVPVSLSIISGLYIAEEQQKPLALFTFASAIGVVLGPTILSFFLLYAEVKDGFILSLIFILLGLGVFALGFRNSMEIQDSPLDFKHSFSRIVRNSNIAISSFILSCSMLALNAVTTFLPVLLIEQLNLDPRLSVTLIMVRSFSIIIMRALILMDIQNRIGVKRFVAAAMLLNLGIPFIYIGRNFFDMVIPVALSGLAHGALYPLSSYIVSKETSPEDAGLANSYFMLIVDAASFLSSALLGIVAEISDLSLVFIIGGTMSAVGALVSFLSLRI